MKGFIYIASAFETVNRSVCGQKGAFVDNDPHFWESPPTWGICRNDLRLKAEEGNVIFFVLPRKGKHPQMIFAYLKVKEKNSHSEAYSREELLSKRMGNKTPNGNIIVDEHGEYNRYDAGAHKHKFEKIKREYVIGEVSESKMLSPGEIRRLAPDFLQKLSVVIGIKGNRAIDIISRKGRTLTEQQVNSLLEWLNPKH